MSEKPQTEKEWQHASWVSLLGKWAWIILIANALLSILFQLIFLPGIITAWEALRPYYEALLLPMPPLPIGGLIWKIIAAVITIFISFAIIKPKFSSKCASKDWEALYGWTLTLGGLKIPWMLIWGIILEVFSWYYWAGLVILIPAIMLIFMGPRAYKWSE